MQHVRVRGVLLGDVRQALDRVAGTRGARVVVRGHDDRDGRALAPAQRGERGELADGRGVQQPGQRGLEAGEDDLGLRVAEAGVELDDPHAPRGDREPRVEQSGERRAPAAQLVHGGLEDRLEDLVDELRIGPRQRRVRAHAARVGPLVPVERALEVLRGLERYDRVAVRDGEERDLRAVEELLDDDPPAGQRVGAGRLDVVGDDDALAGGQAVVLDHVGRAEGVEGRVDLRRAGADVRAGGGHLGGGHHVLGERLGALQPRGFRRGAEGGDTVLPDRVRDARHQRRLRAHHHEVGPQREGELRDGVAVEGVHGVRRRDLGDPGVAGGAVQGGDVGVEGQRAAQGVFAGAAADDEDLHGVQPTGTPFRSPRALF